MNNQGALETEWGDGVYSFRLTVSGIIELEQKCDAAIADIINRVNAGRYWLADIRETIRLGLVGGGKAPAEAVKLVGRYVDDRPLGENIPIARAILLAVLVGFTESPLVETATEESEAETSPPSASMPPPSLTTRDAWGLDPTFWKELASGNGLHS